MACDPPVHLRAFDVWVLSAALMLGACDVASVRGADGGPADGAAEDGSRDAARDVATEDAGPLDAGMDGGTTDPYGPPIDVCAEAAADPLDVVAAATCRGIGTFVAGIFTDPYDQLIADVARRRFGIAALDGMWGAFVAAFESNSSPESRVFGRIGDAGQVATASDLAMMMSINAYTAPALHCRDLPLPNDFATTLATQAAMGDYFTTHVLLALLWIDDLGCADPVDAAFREQVYAATAALVDLDDTVATDLEIEAAVFLEYVGEGARVHAGFLDAVLAAQKPDGGWAAHNAFSLTSGHTTGLAVWYLLEKRYPGRTETMATQVTR